MEKIGDILKRAVPPHSQPNQNSSNPIVETNMSDINKRWSDFVMSNPGKTTTQAMLRSAGVIAIWLPDKVTIITTYPIHAEKLINCQPDLNNIVNEFMGKPFPVEVICDKDKVESLMPEEWKEAKKRREEQELLREKEREEEKKKRLNEERRHYIFLYNADGCKFDNYKVANVNKSAFELCKAWSNNGEDDNTVYHQFLTLAGECGRGKTRMAKTILSHRIMLSDTPSLNVMYQVPDLLNTLKRGYDDGTFEETLSKCKHAELLVLDDLGMQKNTEWVLEQMDSLIDYRYENCKDTVFTTNLTLDKMPQRLASRLSEGEMVVFQGEDYRKTIAKERLAKRKTK